MFHIAVDVRKAGCLQKLPPALIFNCRSSLNSADPFKGILHTLVSVVWEILAYLDSNLHTFEQGKTGQEYKSARNRTRIQHQLALEIPASPSTSIIIMPHTVRFNSCHIIITIQTWSTDTNYLTVACRTFSDWPPRPPARWSWTLHNPQAQWKPPDR